MPNDARELIEYVYEHGRKELSETIADKKQAVDGKKLGESGMARFNALKHQSGYSKDDLIVTLWDEEANYPTRLGDDTHKIYLARWENKQLMPWIDEEPYPWDMSSVSVSKRLLAELGPLENIEVKQALIKLRQNVLVFDEYSFIVPLQFVAEQWVSEGLNGSGGKVSIVYDSRAGLVIEKL